MTEVSGVSPIHPQRPGGGSSEPKLSLGGEKASPTDEKYAFYINSPWGKMFSNHGALPTAQEMHAIMNGVLQATFHELARQEKHRKEVMQHMKEVIEGND